MLTSYIKRHIKIVILIILFISVFALVFSLYDLPVEAVLYAATLCFVIGLVLFVIGFLRYRQHHHELLELQGQISISIEDLPPPHGALEKDYQALIKTLFTAKARIESDAEISKHSLIDYYTLWAHQIKTPIAAMRLILQAEENSQNAALAAELFKIEQYVEMVLQYLRLDSATTDFVIRTYDLDSVIRQAVRKYAKLFILKKIELDFKETYMQVLTDEKWLSFVLEQLLSNALKYTVAGKVSIYARETSLIIEDTGIGIQAEDLPRVFEKGFTGFNGREDKKSTGIGLYLCRRIVQMLGHSISVTSKTGHGTSVTLGLETNRSVFE